MNQSAFPASRRYLGDKGAILGSLAAVILTSQTAIAQTNTLFQVETLSDWLWDVPGTVVSIEQGQNGWVLTSDSDAFTPRIEVDSGQVSVLLAETGTPAGFTVGMKFYDVVDPIPAGSDVFVYRRSFAQPIAEPVFLTSDNPVHGAAHDRWSVMPLSLDAQYGFQAYVAPLLNTEDVAAYFQYYDLVPPEAYEQGILIRARNASFGSQDAGLEIDIAGHGFSSVPNVHIFHLTANPANIGQSTLSATIHSWDPTTLVVELSGNLGSEDNLVLLTHSTTQVNGPISLLKNGPTFGLPLPQPPPSGTDCCPDAPGPPPGWTCAPDPPKSAANCPPSLKLNGPFCNTKTTKVYGPDCGKGVNSPEVTIKTKIEGSISVSARVNGVGPEVSGKISREVSTKVGKEPLGNGENNEGECIAWFTHDLLCYENWIYEDSSIFDPCITTPDKPTCKDQTGLSSEKCPRTSGGGE